MPFYQRLGDVPRKRHVQFRDNGTLLTEEVMGLEGFTGNESILYHLHSPCRVVKLGASSRSCARSGCRSSTRTATSRRSTPSRRATRSPGAACSCGTTTSRSRSAAPPDACTTSSATARATRSMFVHEGSGTLETIFGDVPYKEGDYVVIPRGTTYRFNPEGRAAVSRVRDAGAHRDPAPLPQRVRPDRGGRAVLPPRHPPAGRAAHRPRDGRVPGEGARARRLPDVRRRLPPVRRRRLGRLPLPVDVLDPRLRADHGPHPPAAAVAPDVPGPELRHLLVLPAQARLRSGWPSRSRITTRTSSRRR